MNQEINFYSSRAAMGIRSATTHSFFYLRYWIYHYPDKDRVRQMKKNHMMRRFSNYAYNSVNSNAINHRKKSFKTSNFPWLGCMCFSAFLRAMCCRAHRTRNWDFSFISHRRQPFCVSKRIIELHFNSILHIINPPPAWANIGHMLRLPLNLQNALYRLSWEIST